MAKRAKTAAAANQDGVKAVVIAALTRAIKVIEGTMTDKKTRPAEGAYPVDLTVGVNGDITVGADVPAGKKARVCAFSADEVLAGIVASRKRPVDAIRLLEAGLQAAKEAKADGSLKAKVEAYEQLVLDTATREKCTELKGSAAKAGKIEGKPSVLVRGSHNLGMVSVEVDAA